MVNSKTTNLVGLLYNTNKDYVVSQLKNLDNSLLLHCFAANYYWNSGF